MEKQYKLQNTPSGNQIVTYTSDGILFSIPMDADNTDYQAYLKWVAKGNTPLPAENA